MKITRINEFQAAAGSFLILVKDDAFSQNISHPNYYKKRQVMERPAFSFDYFVIY